MRFLSNKSIAHAAFNLLTAALVMMGNNSWAQSQVSPYGFPVTRLQTGMHVIEAEIAANQPTRMQGLMFRKEMGSGQGMAFVFDEPSKQCMWMKNTLLPLSVAFIDASGKIINIEDMEPQTETNHCSGRAAKYALEMNLGWFAKRGIKAGDAIKGLVELKAQN